MKRIMIGLLTTLIMIGMVSPVFAENAGDKLGRGAVNFFTGWLEVPKQIGETSHESNVLVGATWGALKGLGYGAARMGTGALDGVTFPIPPYGKPIMEPKYVFSEKK